MCGFAAPCRTSKIRSITLEKTHLSRNSVTGLELLTGDTRNRTGRRSDHSLWRLRTWWVAAWHAQRRQEYQAMVDLARVAWGASPVGTGEALSAD